MANDLPADADLERLRRELDSVDESLLENVRARIAVCSEIARLKRANDVPMMQPHRIRVVQERAAAFGERHGIDPGFLNGLYELIIEETCRVEDRIIGSTA